MKSSLRFVRIAGLLALGVGFAPVSRASAQPDTKTPAPMAPTLVQRDNLDIYVVALKSGLLMKANIKNADVVSALEQVATRGNLQVATRGKIKGSVSLTTQATPQSTPEDVLQSLCKAADLSCCKISGVWIIEKSAVTPPVVAIDPQLQLRFADVEIKELISMVAQNSNLKVSVSDDIKGNLDLICLSSVPASQVLAQIALAADLNLVEKDGAWTFSPRKPIAPQK